MLAGLAVLGRLKTTTQEGFLLYYTSQEYHYKEARFSRRTTGLKRKESVSRNSLKVRNNKESYVFIRSSSLCHFWEDDCESLYYRM